MFGEALTKLTENGSRCLWIFVGGNINTAAELLPVDSGILICQQKPSKVKIPNKKVEFLHYINADRCLGKTYNGIVMSDVGALTPNAWCQISETLSAGGVLCVICPTDLTSIRVQAHNRYKSDSCGEPSALLMKRCYQIIKTRPSVIITDDKLNVLNSKTLRAEATPPKKSSAIDAGTPDTLNPALLKLCKTEDQTKALIKLASSDAKKNPTMALTAARGRGKSALLGLLAGFYSTRKDQSVVISGPTLSNCQTVFDFCKVAITTLGLQQLAREEKSGKIKYTINESGDRGQITYVKPSELIDCIHKQSPPSNLIIILDEAANIPAPLLKELCLLVTRKSPRCRLLMSSTISGYEGTGRNFSLKILANLAENSLLTLTTPIRYHLNDPLESLTNDLFLLNESESLPAVEEPEDAAVILSVRKQSLFSGAEETMLKKIVTLFVDSHYKNSPNDLMLLSDAPSHQLMVALNKSRDRVLSALQYTYDGGLSDTSSAMDPSLAHGDLITWKLNEWHHGDGEWPLSSLGIRIVRIATDQSCRRKGYGKALVTALTRAVLEKGSRPKNDNDLFSEEINLLPNTSWIGTSFGLTPSLFKFWASAGFRLVHTATMTNEMTAELSCIMIWQSSPEDRVKVCIQDYRRRLIQVLHMEPERGLEASFVALILKLTDDKPPATSAASPLCQHQLTAKDLARVEEYCRGTKDRAICRYALPECVKAVLMSGCELSPLQATILIGVILQCKSPDALARELGLPSGEVVLGRLKKTIDTAVLPQIIQSGRVHTRDESSASSPSGRTKRQAILERYRKNNNPSGDEATTGGSL